MSADLHKYGYTPRGASLLALRSSEDRHYQGFRFADWPTGIFDTPSIAGSRPAGAVAGAWAVMRHLGRSGYRSLTEQTLAGKRSIIEALETVDGIALCGTPEGGVVGYRGAGDLDMHAVRDGLAARGWQVAALLDPPGFQMLLNRYSGSIAEELANDLRTTINEVRAGTMSARRTETGYGV
jgi:glutamate/tyrosine decarboxylase-like PLP-dependent enzyme